MTNRWDAFTKQELHLIHHALRVLAIRATTEDAPPARALADEAWDYHCRYLDDGLEPISTRTTP